MLKGTFTFDGHILELTGYDINNTLYFDAQVPGGTKDRLFWDQGIDIDGDVEMPDWSYRGIGMIIGTSNLSLEKQEMSLSDGTKFHNEINRDAFWVLGSMIRSAKNGAGTWNKLEGGFHVLPDDVGTVKLVNGELLELSIEDEYKGFKVSVSLSEAVGRTSQVNLFKGGHKVALDGSLYELEIPDTSAFASISEDEFYTVEEIIQRNPAKNYSWLMKRDYKVVAPEEVAETVKYLWEAFSGTEGANLIGGFDVETTGLDITFRSRDGLGSTLVGMVFTVKEGESFYFPVAHELLPNIAEKGQIHSVIDRYFKPLLERKRWSGHNVSFDWKTMYIYEINTNFVFDTLTAARLSIWNDKQNVPLNLKGLSNYILGRDSLELSDFVEGSWDESKSFADLPKDSVKYYACADTDNTFDLVLWFLRNKIIESYDIQKVFEIEVLFSRAIGYSEFYGMYGNPEEINDLDAKLEITIAEKLKQMREFLNWPDFNPRSTKDLPKALYTDLGMPILKRTDSGNPSSDKIVLKRLLEIVGPDEKPLYPFVEILQEYKIAAQLKSNFTSVYDKVSKDGYFFASVNQFLETGRVSITKPNYQSFDDTVKAYIRPRKGFYMFDTDFSSIEYRVLVSIAGEQRLIDLFHDPDFDYHREMASLLYEIPYDQVTPKIRGGAKALNFGIPYGMTESGLAIRMFGDDSPSNKAKARALYNKYFAAQDAVRKFFDDTKDKAVEDGYNSTAFGRRRYYDKRNNNNSRIRRQAGNHPIQGTAADLYKLGVGRFFIKIFQAGLDGKILISAFVHDECVVEVHETVNPANLLGIVRESFMTEIPGWCPLYIGAGYGKSWVEAKKTELPVQVQNRITAEGVDYWEGDVDSLNNKFKAMIGEFYVEAVTNWLGGVEGEVSIPTAERGFIKSALEYADKGLVPYSGTEVFKPTSQSSLDSLEAFEQTFGKVTLKEGATIVEAVEAEVKDLDTNRVSPSEVTFREEDPMALVQARLGLTGAVMHDDVIYVRFYGEDANWGGVLSSLIAAHNGGEYNLVLVDDHGALHETPHKVKITMLSMVTKYVLINKLAGK